MIKPMATGWGMGVRASEALEFRGGLAGDGGDDETCTTDRATSVLPQSNKLRKEAHHSGAIRA